MSEQSIENQILEELEKLKDILSRVRDAESAYRNSADLLDKATKQYSDLSLLEDEIHAHANTTRENLQKIFSVWEQDNRSKLDYLSGEIVKLRISLPADVSPEFGKLEEQVQKVNIALTLISDELNQLKKLMCVCGGFDVINFPLKKCL